MGIARVVLWSRRILGCWARAGGGGDGIPAAEVRRSDSAYSRPRPRHAESALPTLRRRRHHPRFARAYHCHFPLRRLSLALASFGGDADARRRSFRRCRGRREADFSLSLMTEAGSKSDPLGSSICPEANTTASTRLCCCDRVLSHRVGKSRVAPFSCQTRRASMRHKPQPRLRARPKRRAAVRPRNRWEKLRCAALEKKVEGCTAAHIACRQGIRQAASA